MPKIQFDPQAQKLSVLPSIGERIASVLWSTAIHIPYAQIKHVRVQPKEAYAWIKGFRVGTDLPCVATCAVYYQSSGLPELHLYSKCERSLCIDMEGHSTYSRVVFEVHGEDPTNVARSIFHAIGQRNEMIADDHHALLE